MKSKEENGALSIKILILCGLISLCSCINRKVDHVRIFYLPEGLNVMLPIDSCDKIYYHMDMLKDTIISDNSFIDCLESLISNLEPSTLNNPSYDFRIRCVLKSKDGSKRVLCLGEYFGTAYNGRFYEDNSTLRKFLKETIYKEIDISDVGSGLQEMQH
ncbi:MAG: hypothetical protein JW870_21565 [Candidatus Delongbacteria bacterium]|nr:hypothetical protein [Candidatus Delongbacteria bacterium]